MRRDVDAVRLGTFLKALGETAKGETTVYLTGGATNQRGQVLIVYYSSRSVGIEPRPFRPAVARFRA